MSAAESPLYIRPGHFLCLLVHLHRALAHHHQVVLHVGLDDGEGGADALGVEATLGVDPEQGDGEPRPRHAQPQQEHQQRAETRAATRPLARVSRRVAARAVSGLAAVTGPVSVPGAVTINLDK